MWSSNSIHLSISTYDQYFIINSTSVNSTLVNNNFLYIYYGPIYTKNNFLIVYYIPFFKTQVSWSQIQSYWRKLNQRVTEMY